MVNRVTFRGGVRVVEPVPVPEIVSRFQARAALMDAGLLDAVEAAIDQAGPRERLAWAETVEWNRDSPTIAAIGAALGLTSDQIDDLFRRAASISA
jgi:hypothetical protein